MTTKRISPARQAAIARLGELYAIAVRQAPGSFPGRAANL